MPIERSADHPTFELAGNKITSFAAPARGSLETALFRADVPAGVRHYLEAGSDGASIFVVMLPGTSLIRDDGSVLIPQWVQ